MGGTKGGVTMANNPFFPVTKMDIEEMENSCEIVRRAAEVMLTKEEYLALLNDIYHLTGDAIVESKLKIRGV